MDDLADAEDLDSCRGRKFYRFDLVFSQPVLDLVLSLALLANICCQFVTGVNDHSHLARGLSVRFVLLRDGVDVEVKAKELSEGLLSHHPLSRKVALLDILGGQAI